MKSNDNFGYFDALQSPEGNLDLKKVLASARFPIYALASHLLNFQVLGVASLGVDDLGGPDAHLNHLSFAYISPSAAGHPRDVMIYNWKAPSAVETGLVTMIRNMAKSSPERLAAPFDWSNLQDLWDNPRNDDGPPRSYRFLRQVRWESYIASKLQFNMFHSDEPAPFSLAYSSGETSLLTAGAVGLSHSEFLTILSSLICLQDDENLVDKLQEDLKKLLK